MYLIVRKLETDTDCVCVSSITLTNSTKSFSVSIITSESLESRLDVVDDDDDHFVGRKQCS